MQRCRQPEISRLVDSQSCLYDCIWITLGSSIQQQSAGADVRRVFAFAAHEDPASFESMIMSCAKMDELMRCRLGSVDSGGPRNRVSSGE